MITNAIKIKLETDRDILVNIAGKAGQILQMQRGVNTPHISNEEIARETANLKTDLTKVINDLQIINDSI